MVGTKLGWLVGVAVLALAPPARAGLILSFSEADGGGGTATATDTVANGGLTATGAPGVYDFSFMGSDFFLAGTLSTETGVIGPQTALPGFSLTTAVTNGYFFSFGAGALTVTVSDTGLSLPAWGSPVVGAISGTNGGGINAITAAFAASTDNGGSYSPVGGLAIAPVGTSFAGAITGNGAGLDALQATVTFTTGDSISANGLSLSETNPVPPEPEPVPEPASLALLGAGLAGLACARRRRALSEN